jgi:spore coat polysaccharide biosynthesis protein SpsF
MTDDAFETTHELLWAGDFGDAYVQRNIEAERGRGDFWDEVVDRLAPASALELGCNVGANLRWLAGRLGTANVAGVDVNAGALAELRGRLPGVDARHASGLDVPFPDESFDLVLTVTVLIHQSGAELEAMMREVVRCSRRWVLCAEYADEREVEVPYRGQREALFRRDYGAIYRRAFPELRLVDTGFLARDPSTSWDDVTWWIFEKPLAR